jgi:hypothetical protein
MYKIDWRGLTPSMWQSVKNPCKPDLLAYTAVLAYALRFKTHEAALGPLLVVLHRMRMLASSAKDD